MNLLLFAHAGEAHSNPGQSFWHVVAAWYVVVPLFTIILTVFVAVLVSKLLDAYEKSHQKTHSHKAKKHKKTSEEDS